MNTLLATGEVPGLFEGDEYLASLNLCKEVAQRQALMLDSNDELYKIVNFLYGLVQDYVQQKYLPDQAASASSYHPNAGSVTPTQSPIRSMNPPLSKQHSQSSTVSLTPMNSQENVIFQNI
ncbi:unnamed protein product [Adineta steineri]|nr:unnamed protein product [Adineta steineri]